MAAAAWIFTTIIQFGWGDGPLYTSNCTPNWLCDFQGMNVHIWNFSTFLWSLSIVLKLLSDLKGWNWINRLERLVLPIICWGIPLLSALYLTLLGNQWGNGGIGWCWIQGPRNPYRMIFFYGPLTLILIFNTITVVIVLFSLPKTYSDVENRTKKFIMNLSFYPLIMVLCWTGALVNRIQNAADPQNGVTGLYMWEYLLNTTQGFWNSIIFAMALRQKKKEAAASLSVSEYTILNYYYDDDT